MKILENNSSMKLGLTKTKVQVSSIYLTLSHETKYSETFFLIIFSSSSRFASHHPPTCLYKSFICSLGYMNSVIHFASSQAQKRRLLSLVLGSDLSMSC